MGVRLRATAGFCVLIGLVGGAAVTMQAGQAMPRSQTRAANLARMRAESLNGGIAQYRADRCMYTTGAPACLLKTNHPDLCLPLSRWSPWMAAANRTRAHRADHRDGVPGWSDHPSGEQYARGNTLTTPNGAITTEEARLLTPCA